MESVQPPNPHGTPLLRILALLAFAIIIAVLSSLGTYWYMSTQTTQQTQTQQQTYQSFPTIKPTQEITPSPSQAFGLFDKSSIIRSFPFTSSDGSNKELVVIKIGYTLPGGNIPVADIYLTDQNFSKNNAIKITGLSGDNGLGYVANASIKEPSYLVATFSPGTTKKYIVLYSQNGREDGLNGFMLLDETGKFISDKVVGNAYNLIQANKLSFTVLPFTYKFDSWKDQGNFYVVISGGNSYKVLIDASSGNAIGNPQQVAA